MAPLFFPFRGVGTPGKHRGRGKGVQREGTGGGLVVGGAPGVRTYPVVMVKFIPVKEPVHIEKKTFRSANRNEIVIHFKFIMNFSLYISQHVLTHMGSENLSEGEGSSAW